MTHTYLQELSHLHSIAWKTGSRRADVHPSSAQSLPLPSDTRRPSPCLRGQLIRRTSGRPLTFLPVWMHIPALPVPKPRCVGVVQSTTATALFPPPTFLTPPLSIHHVSAANTSLAWLPASPSPPFPFAAPPEICTVDTIRRGRRPYLFPIEYQPPAPRARCAFRRLTMRACAQPTPHWYHGLVYALAWR